jgi:pimeloyl-ACP methyl ester carboxylesterase
MARDDGPPVLIVGGFLTSPIAYRRMRQRLLRRGASSVRVVSLWTPQWLLAAAVGLHPLIDRVGNAIETDYTTSARPLLVIGHSAGGVLARLAIGPERFRGRAMVAAEQVGALVTLGTPHRPTDAGRWYRLTREAVTFLERTAPGAYWAPQVGYLSVASRFVEGGGWRTGFRRWSAGRAYATVLGSDARLGWGDSLIPVDACTLEGARCLTLDGIAHGQAMAAWYGDDPGLDGWWEAAVEVWREALATRESNRRTVATRPAA